MLVWSTILPLKPDNSFDKIYGVFKLWLEGSPHSKLKALRTLPEKIDECVSTYDTGDERVEIYRLADPQALAFRYVKKEGEVAWRTELSFVSGAAMIETYIRIFVDAKGLKYKKSNAKTPYIVKQLVRICGCMDDGPFPCTTRATQMRFSDAAALAGLIQGTRHTLLPVLYIRPTFEWTRKDWEQLEKWIGARAHIVFSPGPSFDRAVANIAKQPLYPEGSITLFVPEAEHPMTLPRYRYPSLHRQMAVSAIMIRDITLQATGTLGPGLELIRSACTRGEYQKLRKEIIAKDASNEEFVKYADSEIQEKDNLIRDLKARIDFLNSEINRRLSSGSGSMSVSLKMPNAQPYYISELQDAVLHTLSLGVKNLNSEGRYAALIGDVLANNKKSDFEDKLALTLKEVLKGKRNILRSHLAPLEKMGFVYSLGTHHQLSYKGDDRYMFTIPKTPSDHRSADNCISDFAQKLFM